MPHATDNKMSNEAPLVNGEKPASQVINRLKSYPVVNDSIETFKSNPYGKKSLEIADDVYNKYGKAVEPYLQTPISYAKPYVGKADELADSGLGHVESRFPIVKENTNTVVEKGKSWVFWPLSLAGQGKDYVYNTWTDEYTKTANHKDRGPGIQTSIMALISTELKIASDFFQAVADFLGPKYEESKKKGADYVKQAQDTAEHYKAVGQDKVQEYTNLSGQKVEEAKQVGQQKADEAQRYGQEKSEQAKKKAEEGKEEAKKQAGQK